MSITARDRGLAEAFLKIVETHRSEWSLGLGLPEGEIRTIEKLIQEAGWEKTTLQTGALTGRYCDIGTKYKVNSLVPLKAIGYKTAADWASSRPDRGTAR